MTRHYRKFYTDRKEWKLDQPYVLPDMADYNFIPEVYDVFEKEYKKSDLFYRAFINSKDLGLITTTTNANERDYGKGIHCDYYKIVDEKKWMLVKIKYGI